MTTSPTLSLEPNRLRRDYQAVRATTTMLCEPLAAEDMVVQTMPDVSPTKWHLAHVTWFFETFVLGECRDYTPFDHRYRELFNSYYQAINDPYPRARRGLLSRPTVTEILAYRQHVDRAMLELLDNGDIDELARLAPSIAVGLQHEQQHQELLLMDIKHVLAQNPLHPVYRRAAPLAAPPEIAVEWSAFDGGTITVGAGQAGFAYDNERPRHEVQLDSFELASRLVTNGEYCAFIADGGYQRPELWLADGWDLVQRDRWRAPLYWQRCDDEWQQLTLAGQRPLDPREPVCHVSYYEADAFATWAGSRLPTEFEWEHAAQRHELVGNFLESGTYHPQPLAASVDEGCLAQLFGDVWEWTASPYTAYPGYRRFEGVLGEYNGKFMLNQMVLRGGACVTPRRHVRRTYRNFYYPHQRWMFAGFRLAR